MCVSGGTAYTVQFSYLTMAFPSAMYPGLLAVTLFFQGVFGFISWPLLATLRLFGDHWNSYIILMLVPTLLSYVWPVVQRAHDRHLYATNVIGNRPATEDKASPSLLSPQ